MSFFIDPNDEPLMEGVSYVSLFPLVETLVAFVALPFIVYWVIRFFRSRTKLEKHNSILWILGLSSYVFLAALFGFKFSTDGYSLPCIFFLIFMFGMALKMKKRTPIILWGVTLIVLLPFLTYAFIDESKNLHTPWLENIMIPLPFTDNCLNLFHPYGYDFECVWSEGKDYSIF